MIEFIFEKCNQQNCPDGDECEEFGMAISSEYDSDDTLEEDIGKYLNKQIKYQKTNPFTFWFQGKSYTLFVNSKDKLCMKTPTHHCRIIKGMCDGP
jgi:hypothetical protein